MLEATELGSAIHFTLEGRALRPVVQIVDVAVQGLELGPRNRGNGEALL